MHDAARGDYCRAMGVGRASGLDLLEDAGEQLRGRLGVDTLSVSRLSRRQRALGVLINAGTLGPGELRQPADERYPLAAFPAAAALVAHRRPYLFGSDSPADPASATLELELEKTSQAAAPLIVGDEVWGELWVASTADGLPLQAPELSLICWAARRFGTEIETMLGDGVDLDAAALMRAAERYEIWIEGHINATFAALIPAAARRHARHTIIEAAVDQPDLYRLLFRLGELSLPIVAVRPESAWGAAPVRARRAARARAARLRDPRRRPRRRGRAPGVHRVHRPPCGRRLAGHGDARPGRADRRAAAARAPRRAAAEPAHELAGLDARSRAVTVKNLSCAVNSRRTPCRDDRDGSARAQARGDRRLGPPFVIRVCPACDDGVAGHGLPTGRRAGLPRMRPCPGSAWSSRVYDVESYLAAVPAVARAPERARPRGDRRRRRLDRRQPRDRGALRRARPRASALVRAAQRRPGQRAQHGRRAAPAASSSPSSTATTSCPPTRTRGCSARSTGPGSDLATGNVQRLTRQGTSQAQFLARTFARDRGRART